MWTHIEDTRPKARKPYRCALCGLTIPKGLQHVKRVGIDSGEGWVTARMHDQCEQVTRKWDWQDWECAYDEWAFRHEELPPETLAELESLVESGGQVDE